MDVLRTELAKVRIPEASTRIFKEECCISFDTPKSSDGLFVDLNTFLAYGREHVLLNYKKTGDSVYLNIRHVPKAESEGRPHKKPTLLAIGVDGGFEMREPDFEQICSITVLPDFVTLPYPSLDLPEKVRLCVDAVVASEGAERKEQVSAWTADKKQVSAYAQSLQQLHNGVRVPPTPSGWKCSKCDKTENLWLNLTDGTILCGRRNFDNSGGNNHALEHYEETKYPVAVKLGTITADLEGADVYSYPEDDTVIDPLLAQHLAHFGIDFASLKKTEMTTAERELDQNVNFDWNRIQEQGKELEPLFGPGYTGLINLGNSCYLASIMQTVFSTRDFQLRYFLNLKLHDAFEMAPADPTLDLNTQLAKLAHGLLSGKYSVPVETKAKEPLDEGKSKARQEGIRPRMFKSLIGAGHAEFCSSRQQDAFEFFQYFLEQVERINVANPNEDPSRCFKFIVEERLACSSSSKVKYTTRVDNSLSLYIPLEAAVNKEEVSAYERKQAEASESNTRQEVVRPRVPLSACFESFAAPEELLDFFSSAINAKTTAMKTTRFATFPEYLMLHMRKFNVDPGSWVPKKLDVFLDVPETIDISHLRAKGLQPNEELLPETDNTQPENQAPLADDSIVSQLMDMGFPRARCEKAAILTMNEGVEPAMNWLLSHMDDPDIDVPYSSSSKRDVKIDEASIAMLVSFGFGADAARRGLKARNGNVEQAAEWIFSHSSEANAMELDPSAPSGSTAPPAAPTSSADLPDGSGKYKLLGFVSHMGSSTLCGHYVAHILKEGKWVIFNDCKVALSGDPPKDMGYLYVFQRA